MWKKHLYNIIITVSIVSIIAVVIINWPRKKESNILFLGDYCFNELSLFNEFSTVPIDTHFVNDDLTTTDLLRLVSNDAKKIEENNTFQLSKLIQKSKEAFISVGMNELFACFNFDPYLNIYKFDENNVNLTLSILYSNLNAIIEDIKVFNEDCKITLLSYYQPFYFQDEIKQIITVANENLNELAIETQNNYLEVLQLGKQENLKTFNNYRLNQNGYQVLNNYLMDFYTIQSQN